MIWVAHSERITDPKLPFSNSRRKQEVHNVDVADPPYRAGRTPPRTCLAVPVRTSATTTSSSSTRCCLLLHLRLPHGRPPSCELRREIRRGARPLRADELWQLPQRVTGTYEIRPPSPLLAASVAPRRAGGSPQQPCLAAPAASAADPPGSAGGSSPRTHHNGAGHLRRLPRETLFCLSMWLVRKMRSLFGCSVGAHFLQPKPLCSTYFGFRWYRWRQSYREVEGCIFVPTLLVHEFT